MRAVATGDVSELAFRSRAVRSLEVGHDAITLLRESDKGREPLHLDAETPEALDQEPLVLILREHQHIRKRAQTLPDVAKGRMAGQLAAHPHVHPSELQPSLHHVAGEAHLIVELAPAPMHAEGPRRPPA